MGQRTLFIAAGHGGNDRGNTSGNYIERDENLKITHGMYNWCVLNQVPMGIGGVLFLDDALDLLGENAFLKAVKANKKDGDYAIDIHLDWRPKGSGALVIVDEDPYGRSFSEGFLRRWCTTTGIVNNGVHDSKQWATKQRGWDDMGFCRPPAYGAGIWELGCLNHIPDMKIVQNPVYQALVMQFIWEAWND